MTRMTTAQVTALSDLLAKHRAITHVDTQNCVGGLAIKTNRYKYDGVPVMRERYLLIAGNGRVFDQEPRDLEHLFDWRRG